MEGFTKFKVRFGMENLIQIEFHNILTEINATRNLEEKIISNQRELSHQEGNGYMEFEIQNHIVPFLSEEHIERLKSFE